MVGDGEAEVVGRGLGEVTTRTELGAALERLRSASGLTLRDLARRISERCDTPIGPSALGDWCRGARLPQPGRAGAFACMLEVLGVQDLGPWLEALAQVRERSGPRPGDGHVPYPGLRSFGPEDAAWFFGRDDLVELTVDRLRGLLEDGERSRLLWVVGPSGAGKSSLLQAGLVPRLDAAGHTCVSMTPGARPMERLARLLAEIGGSSPTTSNLEQPGPEPGLAPSSRLGPDPARWMAAAASRIGEAATVVVVDQFEELLRSCDDEAERSAFVATIRALTDPARDAGHAVVVGLRIDFYAEVATHTELAPSLQDGQVLVGPMSVGQLTDAIVEPARRAGVTLDRGLVALLLRDFVPRAATGGHHDPGALPLLAHALRETWDLAHKGRMTADDYVRAGRVFRAIEESAERVYADLDPPEQELVRQAFLRLIHVGEDGVATRSLVRVADLRADTAGSRSLEVIGRFVDARFLTAGEGTVEIAHEALLEEWPRLAAWIEEDRELLRTQYKVSEAARAWVESGHDPSLLAVGARLEQMSSWASSVGHRLRPSDDEQAFLAASLRRAAEEAASRRRQARRLQALGAAVALSALLAAAFGVTANDARRDAEAARDDAQSRQLAVDARSLRADDPTLAAQLAVTGFGLSPTVEARSAVLESSATPIAERNLGGRGAAALAASGDGALLAVGDSTGPTVRLLRRTERGLATAGRVELPDADVEIYGVALTWDGRTLAVGDTGGRIRLWDVSAPEAVRTLGDGMAGPSNLIGQLAFSPDGTELAAAGAEGRLFRWQVDDPRAPRDLPPLEVPAGTRTTSVAFAAEGLVAVGRTDGRVTLRDLEPDPSPIVELRIGTSQVFDVGFSPDDDLLVTASAGERKVTVWDVTAPARPRPVALPGSLFDSWVNTTAFSRDGAFLAAGSSDQTLRVWDTATWAPVLDLRHPAQVAQILFLPQAPIVVSTAEDGVVRAWDLRGMSSPRLAGVVWFVAYSTDGTTLTAFSDEEARVWDDAAAGLPRPGAAIPVRGTPSGAGDLSSDGRLVAVGTEDGPVDLADVSDPDHPRQLGEPLAGLGDTVQAVAFSGDDDLVAAGSDDSTVGVWDVSNPARPQLVARLQEPTHKVWGVGWSPQGHLLAVTGEDDLVHLYDLAEPRSPRHLAVVDALESDGYSPVFSPDSRMLAVGGSDGVVTLWDVTDPAGPALIGRPITGPRAQVTQLAWDTDGDRLAAAVLDGTAWLWDVSEPDRPAIAAVLRTETRLNTVAFRPGRRALTAGGIDGSLRLWSTDAERFAEKVCRRTGETVTTDEWMRYVPGSPYAPPCTSP